MGVINSRQLESESRLLFFSLFPREQPKTGFGQSENRGSSPPHPPRNTFKISLGAGQVKDCLKTGTKQSLVWTGLFIKCG